PLYHHPPAPFSPLSLHDALPISHGVGGEDEYGDDDGDEHGDAAAGRPYGRRAGHETLTSCALPRRSLAVLQVFDRLVDGAGVDPDRKSTRLNSSHQIISYAVFCL